ncbi:uncharacterized protein ARMOST_14004 [Armillaria ostoyae]|uniref:Uncharacterized protein n=1 Tax=Armillaria ostoyae TaxID=47428 RepID=A0A284RPF0_ARMOS|nr:uncharacterized protein ARMOST_14004 [Armillaria ostoyae]
MYEATTARASNGLHHNDYELPTKMITYRHHLPPRNTSTPTPAPPMMHKIFSLIGRLSMKIPSKTPFPSGTRHPSLSRTCPDEHEATFRWKLKFQDAVTVALSFF